MFWSSWHPFWSCYVFLASNIVSYGSLLSSLAFSSKLLTLCTVFSAKPLDLGYSGLLLMCWNLQSFANFFKNLMMNTEVHYHFSLLLVFPFLKRYVIIFWSLLQNLFRKASQCPTICCSNQPLIQNLDHSS